MRVNLSCTIPILYVMMSWLGSVKSSSCHIPPNDLARVEEPAIRITYSKIKIDARYSIYAIKDEVVVEKETYFVYSGCRLHVYLKSVEVNIPKALENAASKLSLGNMVFKCSFTGASLQGESEETRPQARILKLLGANSYYRPYITPASWYTGHSAVLMISFPVFPRKQRTTIRCAFDGSDGSSKAKVSGSLALEKAGCPPTVYGRWCSYNCSSCKNNGTCPTFDGYPCMCTPHYSDSFCETYSNTTNQPTPPSAQATTGHTGTTPDPIGAIGVSSAAVRTITSNSYIFCVVLWVIHSAKTSLHCR